MEATGLETNPEEMKSESELLEVQKEEAAVETLRTLEDRYGNRHLAVGCCRQPKGKGGFQKQLAIICRWMTHCAVSALRKGHGRQG
jgi:hypothetical protein